MPCEPHGETAGRAGSALRAWLASVPRIPLPFLGLGVYRAWLNVVFETSLADAPSGFSVSQDVFDLVMIVVLLACAFCSRRLTPLYARGWVRAACVALLTGTSLLGYAAYATWLPLGLLAWLYTVMGGAGIALMILLWSELYGMLSPVRICLYYAASLVVGAALGWLYMGFRAAWLPLATAILPLASMRCLRNCHRDESVSSACDTGWASFSFPWKPVLVIAVYSCAYGMLQSGISGVSRPNTSIGTVLCAAMVVAFVALGHRDRFDFSLMYGNLLPFLSAALLILAAVGGLDPWWGNLFANWGYTASQIFIMTMIGSICYHWGASAVWLFGIERSVRSLSMMGGRAVEGWAVACGASIVPFLVIAVLAATFVALREGRLSSAWGVQLADGQRDREQSRAVEDRGSLTRACSALAKRYGCSQREEEVLSLLAQHKTARDIEQELCIANGTAKAHIRHVYQRLDIHSREELFALVEEERSKASPVFER